LLDWARAVTLRLADAVGRRIDLVLVDSFDPESPERPLIDLTPAAAYAGSLMAPPIKFLTPQQREDDKSEFGVVALSPEPYPDNLLAPALQSRLGMVVNTTTSAHDQLHGYTELFVGLHRGERACIDLSSLSGGAHAADLIALMQPSQSPDRRIPCQMPVVAPVPNTQLSDGGSVAAEDGTDLQLTPEWLEASTSTVTDPNPAAASIDLVPSASPVDLPHGMLLPRCDTLLLDGTCTIWIGERFSLERSSAALVQDNEHILLGVTDIGHGRPIAPKLIGCPVAGPTNPSPAPAPAPAPTPINPGVDVSPTTDPVFATPVLIVFAFGLVLGLGLIVYAVVTALRPPKPRSSAEIGRSEYQRLSSD
jgi:hypothetical protein